MTTRAAGDAAVGIYSIGVRGMEVPELLAWAASCGIPFVHLRGGPRGVDLARRSEIVLRRWRQVATMTVPISGVTADLDLADLLTGDSHRRQASSDELASLAESTAVVGGRWVRLLAGIAPDTPALPLGTLRDGTFPHVAVPLLVELHAPGWFTPGAFIALEQVLERNPHVGLLADTAQFQSAVTISGNAASPWLARAAASCRVLHLTDTGDGISGYGHLLAAGHFARAVAAGREVEVAFEWTGPDRDPVTCLSRYRAAVRWWGVVHVTGRQS